MLSLLSTRLVSSGIVCLVKSMMTMSGIAITISGIVITISEEVRFYLNNFNHTVSITPMCHRSRIDFNTCSFCSRPRPLCIEYALNDVSPKSDELHMTSCGHMTSCNNGRFP